MLCLWPTGPHCCKLLAAGKREGGAPEGQWASQVSESPTDAIVVATTKIQTAVIMGSIGHLDLEVMLDSGSSISLLAQANISQMTNITEKPVPKVLLKTALPVVKYVTASVFIQNMETKIHHFLWLVILLYLLS